MDGGMASTLSANTQWRPTAARRALSQRAGEQIHSARSRLRRGGARIVL